jgi:hypothetical protein
LPAVLPARPALPPSDLTGLRDRIGSSGKLSPDQQSALVAELEREVHDLHAALEARQLLLLLRRRRDVAASVTRQIDALLRKTAATQIKLRQRFSQDPASAGAGRPTASASAAPSVASPPHRARPKRRRLALQELRRVPSPLMVNSVGSLVFGGAAGWLVVSAVRRGSDGFEGLRMGSLELQGGELIALLVLGAGIAGALSKMSVTRALLGTMIGVFVATLCMAILGPHYGPVFPGLIAASTGLALGAMVTAAWQRRRRPATF